MNPQRRHVLAMGALGTAAVALSGCGSVKNMVGMGKGDVAGDDQSAIKGDGFQQRLKALEARSGGRLGLSVQVLGGQQTLGYREDEMFAMCSTFKLLLAARILHLSQLGEFPMQQALLYEKKELVAYSPATEKHADADGMTIHALCEAAVVLSDNTAANLLLNLQGGPQGLTRWLRTTVGDMRTRLDRIETDLNTAIAGDPRDTTTPRAMGSTALSLLTEQKGVLDPASQKQLRDWLLASRTGDKRLRAGMPGDWKVGGKTGSGDNGTANDVSIVWSAQGAAPMLVSAYLTGAMKIDSAGRDAILAEVGHVVADWYKASRT
ncbi:class A beta-lactamase [Diaphorobacter caeni]|uniref:class A beta-lactamase n=1 Tax=Diaphorobacter caeni TaxID=2784387 RepID=UPI00188E77FF|nr:class A beta-lactamase [Diaphorobacter caeni]MBF5004342.1 class A beta-lactamase [Diaphorobacter caeni]